MTWQFSSGAIYPQIVQTIVRAILSGEIKPGERLPGVRELAMEASVNPNTMQRAMAELELRGLVQTLRTAGRLVTADEEIIENERKNAAKAETESYIKAMMSLGYTKQQTLELLGNEVE